MSVHKMASSDRRTTLVTMLRHFLLLVLCGSSVFAGQDTHMAKLSNESKQRLQQLFQCSQFVIRWGFIPTVLYLGQYPDMSRWRTAEGTCLSDVS